MCTGELFKRKSDSWLQNFHKYKTLPEITKHFQREITQHFHKSRNTSTNHKTLPQITKHFQKSQNTSSDGKALDGTLARVTKHLHRSKTILLIQTLSQITIHFHKYETPPQVTKHLHNLNNLSSSEHKQSASWLGCWG